MKPGDVYDKNGVPVYPGDLVRTFHFTGPRRRRFYLYHTAVCVEGHLRLIPTSHLEPSKIKGGGTCWLRQELMEYAEVIDGCGPGDCLDWTERAKQGASS